MISKIPILIVTLASAFIGVPALQVAIIGTTGNIASASIRQLSKSPNVSIRCLLRHDISKIDTCSETDSPSSSSVVAASLASLPNVKMIKGDVTDKSSIIELIEGCDAVLALQGPPKPNPLLSLLPFLADQNASYHPYMINYIGLRNIIEAVQEQKEGPRPRIVRITGKGESPFSFFTILINMLGYMAKAWNYEGEQLLRKSGLDYTIIRPGILMKSTEYDEPNRARGLKDNGMDMKVTPVTYDQIAEVCIESLKFDNTKKSTLTVMNVEENEGNESYFDLLANVKEDRREFEDSLISKHRWGARLGSIVLLFFFSVFLKGIMGILLHIL